MAAPPQVGKKGALRSVGRCPDGVGGPGRRSRSGRDPRPGPDRGRPAHHRRAGGRAGSDRAGRAGLRGDDRAGRHRGRDQLAGEQVPARAGCPREPTHTGRLVGRRPRTIRTLLGLLGISRGYYHCGSCQHAGGSGGFAPLDVVLGVTGSSLSPGLARAAALAGAEMPYAKGFTFIGTVTGQPPRRVRRLRSLGRLGSCQGTRTRGIRLS